MPARNGLFMAAMVAVASVIGCSSESDGVPEGNYFLRFNDMYLWTDARQVELRSTQVQRPSLEWNVPAGTALDLHVSGLTPWHDSDILRLSSPNGGTPMEDRRLSTAEDFAGALPPADATQLDVRVSRFFTLLDGSQGDSLCGDDARGELGCARAGKRDALLRPGHSPQ